MSEYYDGTKLLSLKDIDGNIPEIYICTSNRTAGKTTYFNRLLINRFKKQGKKFGLIYRYNYELTSISEKFFKDIGDLFFKGDVLSETSEMKQTYLKLYLNKNHCGYVLALNKADQIKKMSHLFSDIDTMLFDEFMPDYNNYCPNEVSKLISIHTSVARGQGERSRYVPVYMVGNPVTLLNPYYVTLGISTRLSDKTRFLRGKGFVLEQGYNASADNALSGSSFLNAFEKDKSVAYSKQGVYLNDTLSFIEKPSGKSRYIATLIYKGVNYAIREFKGEGIIYCDNNADLTFPVKISLTTSDHQPNYIMLKNNSVFLQRLRYFFEHGCFRFKDLTCKECVLCAISY